jgi:hypothetical protein
MTRLGLCVVSLILMMVLAGFAEGYRYVRGRGVGTDESVDRAHSEALENAQANLQNACPSGRWYQEQVTSNECHPSGIGSFTCTVEITGACEQ